MLIRVRSAIVPDVGGALTGGLAGAIGATAAQAIGSALQGGILSVAQGGKFADGAKGGLIGFGLAKGINWANNKMASWAKGKQGGADVKADVGSDDDSVEVFDQKEHGDLLDDESTIQLRREGVAQAKELKQLVADAKAGDSSALAKLDGIDLDLADPEANNALKTAEQLGGKISLHKMGVKDGNVAGYAKGTGFGGGRIYVSKTLVNQALTGGSQRHMLLHEVLHLSSPHLMLESNHDRVYQYQGALE